MVVSERRRRDKERTAAVVQTSFNSLGHSQLAELGTPWNLLEIAKKERGKRL